MTSLQFIGRFTVTFAVIALFLMWLIVGEWSPLHGYFLEHLAFKNTVLQLTFFPYMAVIIINPETEFGDMLVATVSEFMQWLVVGCVLALGINFVRQRKLGGSEDIKA